MQSQLDHVSPQNLMFHLYSRMHERLDTPASLLYWSVSVSLVVTTTPAIDVNALGEQQQT
jgi:hypothetical protein